MLPNPYSLDLCARSGLVFLFALRFSDARDSHRPEVLSNRAKRDAYECGIDPTPQPIGGGHSNDQALT